MPLVDVLAKLVGRVVDVHRMVADRVRLDRRLDEAAEELEQVGVGGHATQKG